MARSLRPSTISVDFSSSSVAVGRLDLLEVVDDHQRRAAAELADHLDGRLDRLDVGTRAGGPVHEQHLGVVRDLGQCLRTARHRLQAVLQRADPQVVEDRAHGVHPRLVGLVELAGLHGDELLGQVLGVVLVGEVEDRAARGRRVAGELERERRLAEALGPGEQDQRAGAQAAADELVEAAEAGLPHAPGGVAAGEHAFVTSGQGGPHGRELLVHTDIEPVLGRARDRMGGMGGVPADLSGPARSAYCSVLKPETAGCHELHARDRRFASANGRRRCRASGHAASTP